MSLSLVRLTSAIDILRGRPFRRLLVAVLQQNSWNRCFFFLRLAIYFTKPSFLPSWRAKHEPQGHSPDS